MIKNMTTKEIVATLYILPFIDHDISFIRRPSLDLKNEDRLPVKCSSCGQLLHVPFNESELGSYVITMPVPTSLRPKHCSDSVVAIDIQDECPSIMFHDRKVFCREAFGSSISYTNEKDTFEIYVRDIEFDDAPKHICPLSCQNCNEYLGNPNDFHIRVQDLDFCSDVCADDWIEENMEDCK